MAPLFLIFISLTFTEVVPWTIDLPEVRKYFFEKHQKYNENPKNVIKFDDHRVEFDNINPDSPHNSHYPHNYESKMPYENKNDYREENENDVYGERYAGDYRDHSYMEKKVHDIADHGSEYLEGLRRSVEAYEELLKNCSLMNFERYSNSPELTERRWLPGNERPTPAQENQSTNINQFGNRLQNANQTPKTQSGNQPNSNQVGNQPPNTNQGPMSSTSSPLMFGSRLLTSITTPAPQLSWQQCERATRAREHVRRLAELTVWATRELQDRAYAKRYEETKWVPKCGSRARVALRLHEAKDAAFAVLTVTDGTCMEDHDEEDDEEETELLLKLAMFLDRLAYLTGFEPHPKEYIPDDPPRTTTTTAQPISLAFVPIPQPVTQFYMNCLKNSSSDLPAPERCTFPEPMPEELSRLLSVATSRSSTTPSPDNMRVLPPNDAVPRSSVLSEVLLPADTDGAKVTAVKSIKKRSLTGNPMLYFMKYYAKHQVWQSDNSDLDSDKNSKDLHDMESDGFNINNNLDEKASKKVKRSIKKFEHLRLPEDPYQDISYFIKHQGGVHYVKNDAQVDKIKLFLEKIRKSDSLVAKNSLKNLEKSLKRVTKRSIDFTTVLPLNSIENSKIQKYSVTGKALPDKNYKKLHKRSIYNDKKVLPEKSRNPVGDISYYIKNKPGTNINRNPVQAAQVRAGLEQIFQNGQIELVHRYGSRGPEYSNAILQGALITFSDLI